MSRAKPLVGDLAVPLIAVAAFSILPFVQFLDENREELGASAIATAWLLPFLPGALLVVASRAIWGRAAAWRAGGTWSVAVFVFFYYDGTTDLANVFDADALAVWTVIFAGALVGAFLLTGHARFVTFLAVAGVLMTIPPAIGYAAFRNEDPDGDVAVGSEARPLRAANGTRSNVYFFVFDGYARGDQLRRVLGYDNSPFLNSLRDRGFVINDRARTSYPLTFLSLPSTLNEDYPIAEDGRLGKREPWYRVLQGDNTTVKTLQAAGYRYVHAASGAWPGSACGGKADDCVQASRTAGPFGAISERDWAMMEMTPLTVVAQKFLKSKLSVAYSEPDDVVRRIQRARTNQPFLLVAHVLAPHQPYRYRPDCGIRPIGDPSINTEGGEREQDLYLDALRCVNRQAIATADRIRRTDPNGIVIFQSDHGSAFQFRFDRRLKDLSPEQVAERYSAFSAIRMPARCRSESADAQALVNTFRVVLACIEGREPQLLPYRAYLAGYETDRIEAVPVPLTRGERLR